MSGADGGLHSFGGCRSALAWWHPSTSCLELLPRSLLPLASEPPQLWALPLLTVMQLTLSESRLLALLLVVQSVSMSTALLLSCGPSWCIGCAL